MQIGRMKKLLCLLVTLTLSQCKEEPKGKSVAFAEACGGKYWAKEVKGLYDQICKFESQLQYREFSIIIIKLLCKFS